MTPEVVLNRGKVTTLYPTRPEVTAVAINGGQIVAASMKESGKHAAVARCEAPAWAEKGRGTDSEKDWRWRWVGR